MKIFLIFIGCLSADDGHNEDCKDIDIGTKCEYECEAVNKEKSNDTVSSILQSNLQSKVIVPKKFTDTTKLLQIL